MAYTAQNIYNIVRDGMLDEYIQMARERASRPETPPEILYSEIFQSGKFEVSGVRYGHLQGRVDIDVETARPCVVAWLTHDDNEIGRWPVDGFVSQTAARAYAVAAVKNKLVSVVNSVCDQAAVDLAALEKAKEDLPK